MALKAFHNVLGSDPLSIMRHALLVALYSITDLSHALRLRSFFEASDLDMSGDIEVFHKWLRGQGSNLRPSA